MLKIIKTYKTHKIFKMLNNGKIYCVHQLEDSILLRCRFYPNQFNAFAIKIPEKNLKILTN